MKRRLTATRLLASLAFAPLVAIPAATAQAQSVNTPSRDLVISIGQGQLVTVPGSMTDVFIADDKVADVQVKSQRQLYVFGKAGGETTIYASNANGDIVWSANVRVGSNIGSLDQMLSLAMPEAKISAATMGNNAILLTGTVAAPEDAAEAERLVKAYVGEDANVISRLKMATPLQVNLRVRFAEVSRSLVRAIGANLLSADSSDGISFSVGSGRSGAISNDGGGTVINTIAGGTTLGGMGKFLGLDLTGALDLAETDGLVTTLSQPNLTALSGESANFLAGGEFPIPVSQGLGTTAIEYRKYGVSLSYTPTVLANGRISLRVKPEVSELSTQGSVTLNGFQVPALTIRRAETSVELGSGQSFMIAGLLSNNAQSTIEKAPGLGDIPILGNLFRSRSFRKGETELVIVVTPYLVNPVNDSDIKLPTDGFRTASELDALMGRESAGQSNVRRPMPSVRGNNSAGNAPMGGPAISSAELPALPPVPVAQNAGQGVNTSNSSGDNDANRDRKPAAPGFSI